MDAHANIRRDEVKPLNIFTGVLNVEELYKTRKKQQRNTELCCKKGGDGVKRESDAQRISTVMWWRADAFRRAQMNTAWEYCKEL